MVAILVIIGIVLIVCTWSLINDYILFKKFKVGYTIELYYMKHIALDYYELAGTYKILAIKGNNISCVSPSNVIIDFNLYDLVSKYDKIVITEEDGNVSTIQKTEYHEL